jgi:predicted ATPase
VVRFADAQFLHYLLRAEPEARLLVAATARPEELEEPERVGGWLAAMRVLGVVAEIQLDRLSNEEAVLLAERIAGSPLDPDKARRLCKDSEGVPLFVVESARSDAEVSVQAGEMSDRVRAVIASRLARLSESAAELVGVAATIGREFTVPVLAQASGTSEEVLVRGLDELWRRAIVRARGPSSYDFSHGKIREAAYAALSPPEARNHHLRVARAVLRS